MSNEAPFDWLNPRGEIAVERGPLGRFVDLADQIRAEGQTVPQQILDVLDQLQQPRHQEPKP